jgi:hypothetical protein
MTRCLCIVSLCLDRFNRHLKSPLSLFYRTPREYPQNEHKQFRAGIK